MNDEISNFLASLFRIQRFVHRCCRCRSGTMDQRGRMIRWNHCRWLQSAEHDRAVIRDRFTRRRWAGG